MSESKGFSRALWSMVFIAAVSLSFIMNEGRCFAQGRIVGYYAGWNSTALPYDNIEYSNLTDIIVAFGNPDSDGTVTYGNGIPFAQLVKSAHAAGSGEAFSAATSDSAKRANLIANVVSFLETNNYDGVDIDWETPLNAAETGQLTSLIQEMRYRFEQIDTSWLITMAIPATGYGGQNFDIQNLVNYVDWFNVMCYDFVGAWSAYSGYNSPLYESPNDPNQAGSDSAAAVYWIGRGGRGVSIPGNKLVIGIPFYAVQFNAPGLYRKLTNTTTSNPYYPDVMSDLSSGWTYNWDDISQVPYLLNGDSTEFITFEDTNSVKLKVQYVLRRQLGGVMIWELSQDLYQGRQPLLETIANTMRSLTSISNEPIAVSGFRLFNNYPNPFNPGTIIKFSVPNSDVVKITVYDVLGRLVSTLADGWVSAGEHEVTFDGNDLSSGVYFYSLTSGGFVQTRKMLLLK